MAPSTHSDPFVAAAFWTGLAALGLTIALSLQIVRLRVALRRNDKLEAQAFERWRPVLHAAVMGDDVQLPALAARERVPFLKLWVHLQGSLRGQARDALNDIARQLAVDQSARAMLERGPRAERLLAALTLGHAGDTTSWPQLLRMAALPDKTLALTALWALVRIDPRAAADFMLPLFVERDDWALSRVTGVLQQAGEAAGAALAALLPGLPQERLPRALRIAEALRLTLPHSLLADALRSERAGVLIAALRCTATPESIDAVRALLGHANWQVRVQAAKALGRTGTREDMQRLAALLADPEWWVRYRSAQALAELAALYGEPLDALHARLTDRFAADMLVQVMAEKAAA